MSEPLTEKQKERLRKYIFMGGFMDKSLSLYACRYCDYRVKALSDMPLQDVLWSDGVTHEEYPYSIFPELWYCPKCQRVYRTSKLTELDTIVVGTNINIPEELMPWKDTPRLLEPQLQEYRKILRNQDFGYDVDLEMMVRRRMWQKLNNKYRPNPDKGEFRHAVTLTNEHRELLNDLHPWLYEGNVTKALIKAEALRQLGRFELSLQLLDIIQNEHEPDRIEADWLKVLKAYNNARSTDLVVVGCWDIDY